MARSQEQRYWDKWLPKIAGLVAGVITLIIGAGLLWALYGPTNPITITEVHVDNGQVVGGELIYTVHSCKHTTLPANLYRSIFGVGKPTYSYTYPVAHGVVTPGCHVTNIPLQLPSSIPPGKYYLRNDAQYQVNALRQVNVYSQSNIFTVVAAK